MTRLTFSVAVIAAALATLKSASDFLAAATCLLTLALLAGALLGIPRRSWVGFCLLGWGYLALAWQCPEELPTTMLLEGAYPHVERRYPGALECLEQPLAMHFPTATPIDDVLKHVTRQTGIEFYLDPSSFAWADKTVASTVEIDLEGAPLRVTLGLVLAQLGLGYRVEPGFIRVTHDTRPEAFYRIGHCFSALLLACAGAMAGKRIDRTLKETP